MLRANFALFLLRNRFTPRDIFPSVSRGVTRHDFKLARNFHSLHVMRWHFGDGELAELNRAFAIVEYMAQSQIDHPEEFGQFTSTLSDKAWNFAIKFAPFNKIHITLENLERVHAAMLEACLGLNAAMASMESALVLRGADKSAYQREQSKATSSLPTFSALYASYIDVCYRIRDYSNLRSSASYSRAVRRILGKNAGKHGFVKGLRNFILHYHLLEPEVSVSWGEARSVKLLLDANSLLYSGFKWTSEARVFIQSAEKLDVIEALSSIVSDVQRQIRFHRKIAEHRLAKEKFAYDTYLHERLRYKHLHNSVVDMGKIVKRSTTVISRILDENVIPLTVNSTMPDEEVRSVLISLADRHQNLTEETKQIVELEIDALLKSRPQFPNRGSFLNGVAKS